MKNLSHKRDSCRLCNSKKLEIVLPLGSSPVSEKYTTEVSTSESINKVPLDLYFCLDCFHVQLLDIVEPEFLWSDYTFLTSNNTKLIEHFQKLCDRYMSYHPIEKKDFIIDIGSNDGTLLKSFKELGFNNILGVEPSKEISAIANINNLPTLNKFFNKNVAKEILNDFGKAKLITANNVFAHIDNLREIAESIKLLLADDGIFVFEVSYLLDVVNKTLIGTIFHEHLSYHSILALRPFLNSVGLEIIRIERGPEQGGSIVVYAQLVAGIKNIDSSVEDLIELEINIGLNKTEPIKEMFNRLESLKEKLKNLFANIKSNGKSIAGFGAARAGTTLLSYFEVGKDIDFLVDDNKTKHNKYSPGDQIKVLPVSEIYNKKPNYILILAWLYTDNIIKKHSNFIENGGKFISILPDVKVI